ncbi:MAG: hypothetical protein ACRYG2_32140 [Janthinobacterium lividum]
MTEASPPSAGPRVLLMTATVVPEPNVSSRLAVLDPADRRRQYEEALRSYADRADGNLDGIVLAENSGADLSGFEAVVPKSVPLELLSIPAAPSTPGTRRGYLEMALVADAFASSHLLDQPGAVGVKVTGRYRVENLGAVVRSLDPDQDLGFNLRRYPRPWADMWVFFANQSGIAALRPHLPAVNAVEPGGSAELSMFRIVNELHDQGVHVQRRFGVEPRLSGTRGVDNARYDGPVQRAKWATRSAARRLAPHLWI